MRRRRYVVGVLERRNPLPVGRYWIDAMGEAAIKRLDQWLKSNRKTVKVERTEFDDGLDFWGASQGASNWVVFRVLEPTRWGGPGIPSVADSAVKRRADTIQSPKPEPYTSPFEAFSNAMSSMGTIALLVALYLLSKGK
jgi:hypothetical protein